jgi:hypothetical protein
VAKKTRIGENNPSPCDSGKKDRGSYLPREKNQTQGNSRTGGDSKKPTDKRKPASRQAQGKTFPGFKGNGEPDYPYPDAQEIVYDGWELLDSDPNAAARIRSTIFLNPYLIPLVLGQEPEPLPIWPWINLMGLDYAEEYFDWYEELWLGHEEALSFLRFVWEDPAIRKDYGDWICYGAAMQEIKEAGPRRQIIELQRKIEQKKLSKSFLTRLEKFLADKAANKTNKNRMIN